MFQVIVRPSRIMGLESSNWCTVACVRAGNADAIILKQFAGDHSNKKYYMKEIMGTTEIDAMLYR